MDVIPLLKRLISIDSSNPFHCERGNSDGTDWKIDGNETEIAEFLEAYMKEGGFRVRRQPVHEDARGNQYFNILAEKGKGKKSILFYAHMDTVTTNPWLSRELALTPRLERRIHNRKEIDVIVGLGACDMKAGAAVIANAFRDINPENYKIKVAFGVDEEFYSLGANVLGKSEFMDDVCAILIPEIDDGPNASYGHQVITLGRLGRCEFVIEVPGTGGHGAQADHPEYISAANQSARIVNRIEQMMNSYQDQYEFSAGEKNREMPATHINGSFYVNRLEAGDGTLSIPATGKLNVSFSCTPNQTFRDAQNMLERMVGEMKEKKIIKNVIVSGQEIPITIAPAWRPTPPSEAYCISSDHPFTDFIKGIVQDEVGFLGFNMGYSVADENVFARLKKELPILVLGPVGDRYHRADEWVGVDSVQVLEKLYRTIGLNFHRFIS